MRRKVERHHWLNTIIGLLDGAFILSDEEQVAVTELINRLLVALRIPERSRPKLVPASIALEASSGYYTVLLTSPRSSGRVRTPREVSEDDIVVSVETWAQSFLEMFTVAYPDLDFDERTIIMSHMTQILTALGVPRRAAMFFPEAVIRAYLDGPDSKQS